VKFRAKIFLAILLPSSALVGAAVAAALAGITERYEDMAQRQLDRTRKSFEGTLEQQLEQLKSLSRSFEGSRFDAAVTEAVESGDFKTLKQELEYQFERVGRTPDFYELRDAKEKVLLRKGVDGPGTAGPPQKWRDPAKALTEFDGKPFLAVRFDYEKGTLVIGNLMTETLDKLTESFGIQLVLVGSSGIVYPSKTSWTPAMGVEGTVFVQGKRFLATKGAPPFSELVPVVLMADMSNVDDARRMALLLGICGLAVAMLVASLVSSIVSRGVSTPVEKLVEAARKIAAGDYNVKVQVSRADEIGRLAGAFNEMTDGLRKRQEIMDKTLSRDVAEEFLKGTDRRPDRRIVTIVFMDIRGYTSGTEGMDPGDVVVMLNELMDLLSGAIVRNGGIVNKFLGDGLMAMFGAPKPLEGHALKAVKAGLEMQKWMERWNDRRLARNLPSFYSGIGINTGVAMCGKVGAQDRMEYTLIGEEVNLASRICGKAAPKQVLVTKQTWDMVKDQIKGRELEPVVVKGLSYPIKVFEVLE
jgi:class 3 adenylate cyclase